MAERTEAAMTDIVGLMLATPAEPPNGEYEVSDRRTLGGKQLTAEYPNGYGASVIIGPYTYGGDRGFYELAVVHDDVLCYATPLTDDVIGWLSPEKVVAKLHEIAHLPRNDDCSHKRPQ